MHVLYIIINRIYAIFLPKKFLKKGEKERSQDYDVYSVHKQG